MDKRHDRLFREGMEVPQDIDGGSAPRPKPKPAPKPAPAASASKRKDKAVKYPDYTPVDEPTKMAKGGVTRADGCAQRGKTKGRMV
jgi:hypothetical protein